MVYLISSIYGVVSNDPMLYEGTPMYGKQTPTYGFVKAGMISASTQPQSCIQITIFQLHFNIKLLLESHHLRMEYARNPHHNLIPVTPLIWWDCVSSSRNGWRCITARTVSVPTLYLLGGTTQMDQAPTAHSMRRAYYYYHHPLNRQYPPRRE